MKNPHAQALGKLGGKASSPAKREAARRNWEKASAALKAKRATRRTPPRKGKKGMK